MWTRITALLAPLAAIMCMGGAAFAKPFDADITGELSAPISSVSVTVNPEIVSQARTFPYRDSQDFIGPRDARILAKLLEEQLQGRLDHAGLLASAEGDDEAGLTLNATILSVRTNNPGFTERGQRANISAAGSVARGEASVEAFLTNADGDVIATFSYSFEEPSLDEFSPRGPWTTARRVFNTFARRVTTSLADAQTTA